MSLLATYLQDLRTIRRIGAGVPETSYYTPLVNLFNSVGKTLKPKVYCVNHLGNTGAGIPEAGFFTASQIQRGTGTVQPNAKPSRGTLEVKPFDTDIDRLQASEQVRRYLSHYNQLLITNFREFRLLALEDGNIRKVEDYKLAASTDALFHPSVIKDHQSLFPDFLERVLRRQSSITDPRDLAWFLASYARETRARAETHSLRSFATIKKALEESLGLQFEGEKGEHFFRSTLVQTLFYGIFSAWVLWCRTPESFTPNARFDWRVSASYLHVPVLRKLFNEVSDPGPLNETQIAEMLALAGDTLARVDRTAFFERFSQTDAVQYFYEPFLEAFDPQLRKDLGVWYTPREIISYMVERVDYLLRTELAQPLGLASPDVTVLDPCCGTGAYLTAVLDRIHRTLLAEAGDDNALVPDKVRTAALTRIYGFEILPAPFVIAHLQLAAQLAALKAPFADTQRAGVFLTNALTGWVPARHPQTSIFPDLQRERENAEAVKRSENIVVIIGNPPYNGYAGLAKMDEELDLQTIYKQRLPGLPKPEGKGLNDLYIRFFRIAERRLVGAANFQGNASGTGITSFISNSSWLEGFSHPTMRRHLQNNFTLIQIDNLNGDKYRTGKKTPEGLPDPSVFSTPFNPVGIQPGTAITTLVKKETRCTASILIRSLWGIGKLEQLKREESGTLETPYSTLVPEALLGIPFAKLRFTPQYLTWPLLTDLFVTNFNGIQTSRDAVFVDIDRQALESNIQEFLAAPGRQFEFHPWQVRRYLYRPFDLRYIYWDSDPTLLVRSREEYVGGHFGNTSLVLPKQHRSTFSGIIVSRNLVDLNSVDGGASIIADTIIEMSSLHGVNLLGNLSHKTSNWISTHSCHRSALIFHALAITHCPRYATENSGALQRDWPRIPLPSTVELIGPSVELGRHLALLLDAESTYQAPTARSFLARLVVSQPPNLAEALKVTAGWGARGQGETVMPGSGKSPTRHWTEPEREKLATLAATESLTLDQALTLLGDTCVDVYLNGDTLWTAVPANVWTYTLGGYQVLKKWLSYRELSLLGRPLLSEEAQYFAQVVRRITAILLMGPALDASYTAIIPTATGLQ